MSKVYEIAFQMGGQITSTFNKSMRGANSALGDLQKQITSLNNQQGDLGNLQKLQKSVGTLSREFNQAQQKAQMLGKQLAQTEKPTKQQTQEFNKARTAAAKLKTRLGEQRSELNKLRLSMGATGKSTRDLINDQKALAAQTEKARQAQARLQTTMAKQQANVAKRGELRSQLLDATALAVAMAAPIKVAAQFEQQMAKVAAVSGASDAELQKLTATARNLGATTNWSASQAAEGMEFLAMSGFNTEQSIKAMPGMLNLASAGAIDLGAAADIASNVLTGFNLKASETGRLGDVLTNAFTTSNVDLRMLGETMKYVAPVAAATGVSLEQAAAMAGQLGNAGIQGSNAGTALRAVISRLSAPTGAAAKALKDLGIQTQDASGNLRSVPDILADMNNAMNVMGTATKQGITSAVFGLEAASAATVLLGNAGSGELQKYTESLKKTGTATKVAAKQNATAMGSMRRLSSAVESIGITIGNVLLPPLATLAEMVAGAAGVIDNFAQQFPTLTKVIVIGTAALIAMKIAAIAGGYAWTFVAGVGLTLKRVVDVVRIAYLLNTGALTANTVAGKASIVVSKAMIAAQVAWSAITKTVTAAQWLLNAALMANPIGLVIAAIAALIAAGVLLYKNWDKITAFFSGFWDNLKNNTAATLLSIAQMLFKFSPLGFLMRGFNQVKSWLGNFSLVDSGFAIMKTLGQGIMNAHKYIIDKVKSVFSSVREYLPFSDAKIGPFSELTKSGSAIMSTLADGVNGNTDLQKSVNNQFAGSAAAPNNSIAGMAESMGNSGMGGGGGTTFKIEQKIVIGDNAGDVEQQARRGASEGAKDLIKQLQQATNRERRLSYG